MDIINSPLNNYFSIEAFAKVSNVHPSQPLPSREGNTPLHPSQEGIYSLPLWERARVRGKIDFCNCLYIIHQTYEK
jgi:hypothetical protein